MNHYHISFIPHAGDLVTQENVHKAALAEEAKKHGTVFQAPGDTLEYDGVTMRRSEQFSKKYLKTAISFDTFVEDQDEENQ